MASTATGTWRPHNLSSQPMPAAELLRMYRRLTGERVSVATLLAPVPKPPAIYGVGLNYLQHAHQANLTVPEHPAVFFKNRNSFNHPLKPVEIPEQSSLPDFEGELAFVFSHDCKNVPAAQAIERCVLGFTASNDVSGRCWQGDASDGKRCLAGDQSYHPQPIGQWSFSKSFDTHCPIGPSLLTPDAGTSADGSGLLLQTHLNGVRPLRPRHSAIYRQSAHQLISPLISPRISRRVGAPPCAPHVFRCVRTSRECRHISAYPGCGQAPSCRTPQTCGEVN